MTAWIKVQQAGHLLCAIKKPICRLLGRPLKGRNVLSVFFCRPFHLPFAAFRLWRWSISSLIHTLVNFLLYGNISIVDVCISDLFLKKKIDRGMSCPWESVYTSISLCSGSGWQKGHHYRWHVPRVFWTSENAFAERSIDRGRCFLYPFSDIGSCDGFAATCVLLVQKNASPRSVVTDPVQLRWRAPRSQF